MVFAGGSSVSPRQDHSGDHHVRLYPHEVAAGRSHVRQVAGFGDRGRPSQTGEVIHSHEGGLARLQAATLSALFGPGATLIKKLAHLRLQIPVKVAYVPRTLSTYVIKHILSSYPQHKAIFVVEDSSLEHVRFSFVKTGYYNVNVSTGSEFFWMIQFTVLGYL